MTRSGRALQLFLRAIGSVALLAIFAVFMPYSWMKAVHGWLGMGTLPNDPIVGYLARSTSIFYALLGGLFAVKCFCVFTVEDSRHYGRLAFSALFDRQCVCVVGNAIY